MTLHFKWAEGNNVQCCHMYGMDLTVTADEGADTVHFRWTIFSPKAKVLRAGYEKCRRGAKNKAEQVCTEIIERLLIAFATEDISDE